MKLRNAKRQFQGPKEQKSQSQCGKPAIEPQTAGSRVCLEDIIPVNPKLQNRFYEAIVLLNLLSKSQGDHIDEDPTGVTAEPSDLVGSCGIRRNFLKQLAYICDSEKGGDTTTAIGAEQTPEGLVLWIASNRCSSLHAQRVKNYLDDILLRLRHLQKDRENDVEQYIVSKSAKFCSQRLTDYRKLLETPLNECIKHLEGQSSAHGQYHEI
jgi:hypothetical protein